MSVDIEHLTDEELVLMLSNLMQVLKVRGLIRTKNVVGDLGEYLAIGYYNTAENLPRLTVAAANTPHYDALDEQGRRYTIKAATGQRTSCFHLGPTLGTPEFGPARFDILVIIVLTDAYRVRRIKEYSWEDFLRVKEWSDTQNGWYVRLSGAALQQGRTVFEAEEER